MAHVVIDNCNGCRYTDCVLICPVDCFYELPEQLVIDPDECIDCATCVAECPVEAIYAEDELPSWKESALEFNADAAKALKDKGQSPITDSIEPLPTAAERRRQLGF